MRRCQRLRKRVANFIHTDLFQQTIILGNCRKDLLRQVKAQLRRVLNRFHHLGRVLAENLFRRSRGTNEFFLDILPSVVRIDQLIRIIRDRIDRKRSARHVILDLIAELHRSRPCLICLHTRRALAISADVDDDAVLTREFSFVVIAFFNEFHPENTVRFAEHLRLREKLPQLVKTCVGRNIPTDRLLPQQGIPHTIADSKGLLLCIRQSLHDSGNFLW